MKIMILDGNSLVNRAFYGIRMLNAPDGTPTNAVYGFLAILQRLLETEEPDSVCACFDVHAPTFRHKEYADYKAGRRPMPDDLRTQIPLLKEVLTAMGIPCLELPGWEADDLLGTISHRAAEAGNSCVAVSGDKDTLQLVTDRTRVLNIKTKAGSTETLEYTPASFMAEYGFGPLGMVDLKALMGDPSDNLPGVPGIGEKTALDLMHAYGSLDGVYAHLEDSSLKPAVRKKLEAGKESAYFTYRLATISREAPLDYTPAPWSMSRSGPAYDLFRRLGLSRFIKLWALTPSAETRAAEKEAVLRTLPQTGNSELRSLDALRSALTALQGETLALHYVPDLSSVTFASLNKAYRLSRSDFSDWPGALSLLLDPAVPKLGHNVKDLLRLALDEGVAEPGGFLFDTALAAYLLDSTAGDYGLPRLTEKYAGFSLPGEDRPVQLSLLEEDNNDPLDTACALAAALHPLGEALRQRLRETQNEELFNTVELPLCPVLARMEHAGFLIDRQALSAFSRSLDDGIDQTRLRVCAAAGHEFNINSPKQLGAVLFEELGLPGGKKTKTGWSTNADVLEPLRFAYPIVQDVLDYRELTKLKSTYAEGLLKVIAPDGRIHTSFQMTVTATGRLSSTEPNLQNIPVRKELGALIRGMFRAPEGSVLIDADYSQIELRVLAHISGDENMRAAFLSGTDFHTATAAQVFSLPPESVTPDIRRRAKAVNFGIVYGISAFSLSGDIGVTVAEARDYMNAYLQRFSGVQNYQKSMAELGKERGWVETLMHRRRYLPELKSPQFPTRAFGERVAMNMPIQGTAADIIKLAMVRVDERLRRENLQGRLILQVHDELILECPEPEKDRTMQVLKEEMENVLPLSVPLPADTNWGTTWAEAH